MKDFLVSYGFCKSNSETTATIKSALHLAKNAAYHARTKHIQWRYHWLRERVEERDFDLVKIHMEDNESDMLVNTK